MTRSICLLSIALILSPIAGCRATPKDTVMEPDVSQSIDRAGMAQAFKEIDDRIDGMRRGDSLTIIPITGDAMSDTPGRVVRLVAPTEREAYDNDLIVFREDAHKKVRNMEATALASPGRNTDILGALDAAKQVFDSLPPQDSKTLIVMSDFLEDDSASCFTQDKALGETQSAQHLADTLQKQHGFLLHNVSIHLEALPSKDLRSVRPGRRQAVREFWKRYFAPSAATEINVAEE
jgi:hypothetical protein